jgi:hypothetical protein
VQRHHRVDAVDPGLALGMQTYSAVKLVNTATPGVCIVNRLPIPNAGSKLSGANVKRPFIAMTVGPVAACP